MELTLEQKSAVQRGEVVPIHIQNVDEECVIMQKGHYLDLNRQLNDDEEMVLARLRLRAVLTPEKLKDFAKNHPPPASWHEEDHTGLYEVNAS